MKIMNMLLMIALVLLMGACKGAPTRHMVVYDKDSAVPFENDLILVYIDLATKEMTVFGKYEPDTPPPSQLFIANAYIDTQRPVISENEARAINRLMLAQGFDIVTTKIGMNRGCIEANGLFAKAGGAFNYPGAIIYAIGTTGLYAIAAKGSSIEQEYRKHDTRYINAATIFKTGVGVKNLLTKC